MSRETSDNAAYMREWRKTEAGKASLREQKMRERARQIAFRSLAQTYPIEFDRFYQAAFRTLRLTEKH